MNKAKQESEIDGKAFLKRSFKSEQTILLMNLEHSSTSITHDGTLGSVNELHFIELLRKYLPNRYEVNTGIIIDSNGKTSDQIDVVIYDGQYTPTLLDQKNHRFIPAEAVYAVFEVKPTINKSYLDYASQKAESVRSLLRTSIPIAHAGGEYPAKKLFPIIAGIIGANAEWQGGLCAKAFVDNIITYSGNKTLDCGLAVNGHCFDFYDGALKIENQDNSLVVFIFKLLQKLQSLGTVPAIDWKKYAAVFSD